MDESTFKDSCISLARLYHFDKVFYLRRIRSRRRVNVPYSVVSVVIAVLSSKIKKDYRIDDIDYSLLIITCKESTVQSKNK
jgi:hypothetical protein